VSSVDSSPERSLGLLPVTKTEQFNVAFKDANAFSS
jgi:hypothetical protein